MNELCDPSHSEQSFKNALQDLPEGLTATYERVFQKITRRSIRQKALAESIFDWTLCARRPLRFDELKHAVVVEVGDTSWNGRNVSAETEGNRFINVCANLVVFHERDSTVRLAHHTVGQFLDQHKRGHSQTDVKIGELCLTYLGFSDFETQVVSVRKDQDIFGAHSSRQAGFHRIPQVLGLSNGIYDFMLGLYNRNNKLSLPDANYAELTRRYQRKPLPKSLAQKYYLLDYVTVNWIWHTKHFDPNSPHWSRFENFVFHKALPFDFRPWGTREGPSNLPHLELYLWSLENSHLPLLQLLRDLPGHCSLRPYLRYKTLCRDRLPPHLRGRNGETAPVEFHKYPDAYDWPAKKIFLEGRTEIFELCLQEDPSIISYRHIMVQALKEANFGVINKLLRGGAKFLKTEIDATNALHSASRKGNQKLVKMLLDLGADANSRLFQDERGRTPLYEAFFNDASRNHGCRGECMDSPCTCSPLDTIQLLLDHGADPNAKQVGGETALHMALGFGEAYVRLLLSQGADVEASNDRQETILDLAIDTSDKMIDVLVEYGVNLEARDAKGRTALLKAIQRNSVDTAMVKTLIAHGANVHAKDNEGKTVLHHTLSSRGGILQRFLDLGVDVNAADKSGTTALGIAVRQNRANKFDLLLDFGAVFAETDYPLSEAAAHGNTYMVDTLLDMGIDPNASRDGVSSPISLAAEGKSKEIVTSLLEAGADPNLAAQNSLTPLARAVKGKDKEIVKTLIEAGAAIHPPDYIIYSPLYMAIAMSDVPMVDFLIRQGANVSSFRPRDWSGLRANHAEMCHFLTELGVPITLYIDEYDD